MSDESWVLDIGVWRDSTLDPNKLELFMEEFIGPLSVGWNDAPLLPPVVPADPEKRAAVVAMIAEGMDLPADLLDPGTYAPTSTAEPQLVWDAESLAPDWHRNLRHGMVLAAAGKLTWTDDLREAVRVITFDGTDAESPYLLFETEIGAYCRVQILSGVVSVALGADWLISDLFVPEALRGAGVGTLVLSTVLAEADRFEAVCLLGAAQSGGEMSQEQLVEWYRKFGFEPVTPVAGPVMRRAARPQVDVDA